MGELVSQAETVEKLHKKAIFLLEKHGRSSLRKPLVEAILAAPSKPLRSWSDRPKLPSLDTFTWFPFPSRRLKINDSLSIRLNQCSNGNEVMGTSIDLSYLDEPLGQREIFASKPGWRYILVLERSQEPTLRSIDLRRTDMHNALDYDVRFQLGVPLEGLPTVHTSQNASLATLLVYSEILDQAIPYHEYKDKMRKERMAKLNYLIDVTHGRKRPF